MAATITRERVGAVGDDGIRLTAQDIAKLQSTRMRLLVTTGHPDFARYGHAAMGRLIQPRHTSSVEATDADGIAWAADNDCFQGLDEVAYVNMLDRIKGLDGCLWATVPDKVGDALETACMFEKWAPALERRGIPVALVLQNGHEHLSEWLERTWHRLDAVFVGGSNACLDCEWQHPTLTVCAECGGRMQEWKLGAAARELVREAQRRGLWVHVGRVNTQRRLDYCRDVLHADSVDGSKWAKFKDTYLADGLDYCGRARNLTFDIEATTEEVV